MRSIPAWMVSRTCERIVNKCSIVINLLAWPALCHRSQVPCPSRCWCQSNQTLLTSHQSRTTTNVSAKCVCKIIEKNGYRAQNWVLVQLRLTTLLRNRALAVCAVPLARAVDGCPVSGHHQRASDVHHDEFITLSLTLPIFPVIIRLVVNTVCFLYRLHIDNRKMLFRGKRKTQKVAAKLYNWFSPLLSGEMQFRGNNCAHQNAAQISAVTKMCKVINERLHFAA